MKVIRNKILPIGKNYGAINLFGVLLAKPSMPLTPEVMNHEAIHTAQMRELLYLPFYIVYILEWLWRLVAARGNTFKAYRNISFEREAYSFGHKLDYLAHRRYFAQWRS